MLCTSSWNLRRPIRNVCCQLSRVDSCLMNSLIFPLFLSVEVVHGRAPWGRSATSVILSLPSPDVASVHAGVFIFTLTCMNIRRSDFLLQKFYRLTSKRHVLASHFLVLKYDHVTGAVHVILIVVWAGRWNWPPYVTYCSMAWYLFVIPWCHEMSVQPAYAHCYRIYRNVIIAEVGECLEFY